MSKLIGRVKCKYTIQNIFNYIQFDKTIKIIKYSLKTIKQLEYTKEEIKYFLLLKKIVKPIANCEEYLPIIRRILFSNTLGIYNFNNNKILDLFCEYLNKSNKFIPQINQINGNEDIINNLNTFKIGFNQQFINNFYNNEGKFNYGKLFYFCKNYGKKIKEITFMDNNIPYQKEAYFIIKCIIENSNIQRIEDRDGNKNKSLFLDIFNSENDYYEDTKEYSEFIKKGKGLNIIINNLKYYSLYFEEKNSPLFYPMKDIILINGRNIEELELRSINKENSSQFINLLKNLTKIKALSIQNIIDNELFYDEISEVIQENSLIKLKMILKYFKSGVKIINKNLKSLEELTIKIENEKESSQIVKIISDIKNLKILKLIAKFPIFKKQNIKKLNLPKVEHLEMPLYINKYLFDFNSFFEKMPKLKTLIFYGINLNGKSNREKNLNFLEQIDLKDNFVKNLKKIKFLHCKKNSSILITKIMQKLSKDKIKENLREIKIENCEFDKETKYNDLIKLISSFKNLRNLQLNKISFEEGGTFNYFGLNELEKLEKFYFKDINFGINKINKEAFLFFFTILSSKCKYLNEIGISCKNINAYDINSFLKLLNKFKLLVKVNLFENYSNLDYFFNANEEGTTTLYIDLIKIKYYCMVDLRNIDIISQYYYPKIIINDSFYKERNKSFYNKNEKYFIYQNLYNNNCNLTYLFYSKKENTFKIGDYNSCSIESKKDNNSIIDFNDYLF